MIEIMPFSENNIILFYWTAPKGILFLVHRKGLGKLRSRSV